MPNDLKCYFTESQWKALCKKFKLPQKTKSKCLGSGISAVTYSFGPKLVLKLTSCKTTLKIAKKLLNKSSDSIARVFHIERCSVNTLRYVIVQERLNTKINKTIYDHVAAFIALEKCIAGLDNVSGLNLISEILKKVSKLNKREVRALGLMLEHYANNNYKIKQLQRNLDMVQSFAKLGFDIFSLSDVHEENINYDQKGNLKLLDLGCLDFD